MYRRLNTVLFILLYAGAIRLAGWHLGCQHLYRRLGGKLFVLAKAHRLGVNEPLVSANTKYKSEDVTNYIVPVRLARLLDP